MNNNDNIFTICKFYFLLHLLGINFLKLNRKKYFVCKHNVKIKKKKKIIVSK